jgi:hypothetical protein
MPLSPHLASLTAIDQPSKEHDHQLQDTNASQYPCKPRQFSLSGSVFIGRLLAACSCMVVSCCGASLAFRSNGRWRGGWRGLCGWSLLTFSAFGVGFALSTIGLGDPLTCWRFRWLLGKDEHCNYQPFHSDKIVSQKCLTPYNYRDTFIRMANVLNTDKQITVIAARRYVTVLHLHPIKSARDAVRAAIAQEFRNLDPAE